MANPCYESYMQMLLPVAFIMDGGPEDGVSDCSIVATERLVPQVRISICFDNARSLADELSMTMKSLKPKVTGMNRWSSVPDLKASLSIRSKSNTSSSATNNSMTRSIDDLRSLMTNNSRIPRSTDNLRASLSMGSLNSRPKSDSSNSSPPRKNDRWENKPKRQNSGTKMMNKKNLFDLSMPSSLTGPTMSTSSNLRLTSTNSLPAGPTISQHQSLKIPQRRTGLQPQALKIPQRRTSMEPVHRDADPGAAPVRGDKRPSSRSATAQPKELNTDTATEGPPKPSSPAA